MAVKFRTAGSALSWPGIGAVVQLTRVWGDAVAKARGALRSSAVNRVGRSNKPAPRASCLAQWRCHADDCRLPRRRLRELGRRGAEPRRSTREEWPEHQATGYDSGGRGVSVALKVPRGAFRYNLFRACRVWERLWQCRLRYAG